MITLYNKTYQLDFPFSITKTKKELPSNQYNFLKTLSGLTFPKLQILGFYVTVDLINEKPLSGYLTNIIWNPRGGAQLSFIKDLPFKPLYDPTNLEMQTIFYGTIKKITFHSMVDSSNKERYNLKHVV